MAERRLYSMLQNDHHGGNAPQRIDISQAFRNRTNPSVQRCQRESYATVIINMPGYQFLLRPRTERTKPIAEYGRATLWEELERQ
jgi:hypothetical protein